MYTKCVYTFPLTVVGIEFPLKKATLAIRGKVHTKCVYTVALTVVGIEFSLNRDKVSASRQ